MQDAVSIAAVGYSGLWLLLLLFLSGFPEKTAPVSLSSTPFCPDFFLFILPFLLLSSAPLGPILHYD